MNALAPSDFGSFFTAVYGYAPFHWQQALADRVLGGGGWPEAIDVPTGMGKTAVVDVAVFALACQASWLPSERSAPTRTLFVVDRRVIVDQAYERACRLANRLDEADDGIVAEVAAALSSLTAGRGRALEVVRMRGGITWGWRWLRSPDQPAVVVGTVDQAGSRMLFRGYGVSSRLRPIDAALCGADCLLILDEAHLAQPLVETATTIARYEARAERPVLGRRRPRPVVMSATLTHDQADVHRLDAGAEASPVARARLRAQKLVAPLEMTTASRDPVPDLARGMAAIVGDRLSDGRVERVAVVCNTVGLARAVHASLAGARIDADLCLLTGRCRGFERERIAEQWGKELAATFERPPRLRPVVAVATQTIEVGADFDVDLLVTEASPFDALVQRLGRLNRLGLHDAARAFVVHCERRHAVDPVYGPATDRTWAWLRSLVGDVPVKSAKELSTASREALLADLGPLALLESLDGAQRRQLAGPSPLAPVALGSVLASWARTEPAPEPDQVVAPFLHGVGRNVPQVEICWRAGLPEVHEPDAPAAVEAELGSVPVVSGETVEVPIWEARRYLQGYGPVHLADVEGVDEEADGDLEESMPLAAWVKRGEAVSRVVPAQIKPGDTIIVRAEEGGHDHWGWTGVRGPAVVDVADLCQMKPALRLRAGLLSNVLGGTTAEWEDALGGAATAGDESPADVVTRLLDAVARTERSDAASIAPQIRQRAADLARQGVVFGRRSPGKATATRDGGWYVVMGGRTDRPERGGLTDRDSDEGATTSSVAPRRVTLEEHLLDVGGRAAAIATNLGMPGDVVAALEVAGRAHDLGKADWRFQVMLHGGDPVRAEASGVVLAKSGMDPANRPAFRAAQAAAGWPAGMRHEVLSTKLMRKLITEAPGAFDGIDADLVLHLIGSHHGWGRPLFPAMIDPAPRVVTATLPDTGATTSIDPDGAVVDWDAPARFERLGCRYGWWGLALLEATLRLADIACSEEYGREAT